MATQQQPHLPGATFRAKVLFDYEAVETSELSVNGGEEVEVEEVNASGWALAKNDRGQTGWLPADYIERIDSSSSSSSSSSAPHSQPDVTEALNKLKIASQDPQTGAQRICFGCGEAITSAFVLAKDAAFHPGHFKCITCQVELGGKAYMEQDGRFYCEDDFYAAFNPKCHDCGQLIKGPYVSAMDASWHPEHFVCTICKKPFPDQQFRKHDGRPYCEQHFSEYAASKCSRCSKPILGQVFEALDSKWHLECFTCAHNNHSIGEGQPFHVGDNNTIYCPEHYEELFLEKCSVCKKPIKGQYIKVLDKQLHSECWRCSNCNVQLKPENAATHQGNFVCRPCVAQLGGSRPATAAAAATHQAGSAEQKAAVALNRIEQAQAEKAATPASPSVSPSSFADPVSKVYPYSVLKVKEQKPADVDPTKKELYLSDSEFQQLFKVSKAEFSKLPDWKKEQQKKPLGLF